MRKLCSLILFVTVVCYPTPMMAAAAQGNTLAPEEIIKMDYKTLFEMSPEAQVSEEAVKQYRKILEEEKERKKDDFEKKEERIEDEIDQAQERLKDLNRGSEDSISVERRRHEIHCLIQQKRKELNEVGLILDKGLENEYDNKEAKLEIALQWPQRYREVQQMKANGTASERKFGDFRDVGFRGGVFEGQEEDVERGREAIDQLKRQDMLPPEIKDEEVQAYIDNLSKRIARHSDLRVPLKVSVLRSKEVNAFALPGGFFFVNSGLIDKAENEAELAGVIAHELAHITARHADRLMGKANIANIVMQAAQIAALILTGGASSIATYYLLQYGFYGLGLVLNLTLLGISRDFEIEADILGTQYLWHAGYELTGFIDFFGRMAEEEGYVTGLSWFRTHPPFAERMSQTFAEIEFLPEREDTRLDSEQFHNMQKILRGILEKMEEEDAEAPTLRRVYECEGSEGEVEAPEEITRN